MVKSRKRKQRGKGEAAEPAQKKAEAASLEQLAAEAQRALDRLIGAGMRELGLPPLNGTLPLNLPLGKAREGAAQQGLGLLRQIYGQLEETAKGDHAFREGRVYCFFTRSPEGEGTTPPQRGDVFAGYAANGKPAWESLANVCLRVGHPEVDRLYGPRAEPIAWVQWGDALQEGMLPTFAEGKMAYRLWGQVLCGLVPEDLDFEGRDERVALTIQVVETSQPAMPPRLRLNVIGLSRWQIAEAAASQGEDKPAERLRRLIHTTRLRVHALGRKRADAQRRGRELDLREALEPMLRRLKGDLLRALRQARYRTQHAEMRHASKERPTSYAVQDALQAAVVHMLRDQQKGTVVVLGRRRRVHVFSEVGRHVTSLDLDPDEIARRHEQRRWIPLSEDEAARFRERLRGQLRPTE